MDPSGPGMIWKKSPPTCCAGRYSLSRAKPGMDGISSGMRTLLHLAGLLDFKPPLLARALRLQKPAQQQDGDDGERESGGKLADGDGVAEDKKDDGRVEQEQLVLVLGNGDQHHRRQRQQSFGPVLVNAAVSDPEQRGAEQKLEHQGERRNPEECVDGEQATVERRALQGFAESLKSASTQTVRRRRALPRKRNQDAQKTIQSAISAGSRMTSRRKTAAQAAIQVV